MSSPAPCATSTIEGPAEGVGLVGGVWGQSVSARTCAPTPVGTIGGLGRGSVDHPRCLGHEVVVPMLHVSAEPHDLGDDVLVNFAEEQHAGPRSIVEQPGDRRRAFFIRGLPHGFHEPLRERGAGLSTGQKQLINFARALAHQPRILILDEATSSVDTETEIRVRTALDRMVTGRTSVIIAHRLSTVQRADTILVMHKGRLRESGTHQELLAQRGIYWKLYQLQYQEQEARLPSGEMVK